MISKHTPHGLESPLYVAHQKTCWIRFGNPLDMIVVEYCGDGDPAFGGSADDRTLGVDGQILPRCSNQLAAVFQSIDEAHQAAINIKNRRPKSLLGVIPRWR